jgi:PIN domain nuclease of toxin-antitoxin system
LPLLDTHVWAWSLTLEVKPPERVLSVTVGATDLSVSAVTFYEIAQKVRLGKWPAMVEFADRLDELAHSQSLEVVPVSGEIAKLAGALDWPHRDPFDRLIAATALVNGLQLISADPTFDSLIGLRRLWA